MYTFLHSGLTLPHLCACPKSVPGFPMSNAVGSFYFVFIELRWEVIAWFVGWYWWNCWPSSLKHSFHNYKIILSSRKTKYQTKDEIQVKVNV